MRLRVRYGEDKRFVDLAGDATVDDLRAAVCLNFHVPAEKQGFRFGFPPQTLDGRNCPGDLLLRSSTVGLRDKDAVTLFVIGGEGGPTASAESCHPSPPRDGLHRVSPTGSIDASSMPQSSHQPSSLSPSVAPLPSGSIPSRTVATSRPAPPIIRGLRPVIVPADNSCLFRCVQATIAASFSIPQLKQIITSEVRSKPEEYSEAILGAPATKFIEQVAKKDYWGGFIELHIFSLFFNICIRAIDIQTLRIDGYNDPRDAQDSSKPDGPPISDSRPAEGEASSLAPRPPSVPTECVFLLYNGIHYDYLESVGEPSGVTRFALGDDAAVCLALETAEQLHRKKQYTDTAAMTIKCGQCGKHFKGEREALEHAKQTKHNDFSEIER